MNEFSAHDILPDSTRQQVARLALRPRRLRAGGQKGERRSLARGTSLEFADFRPYVAGDDLRKLDWNVYARLDRPVVKVYEDEQNLSVFILIDTSQSMNAHLDTPPLHSKLATALRIAALLGAIGLQGGDAVSVYNLSHAHAPFVGRGRAQTPALLRWLTQTPTRHTTPLEEALLQAAPRLKPAGMCFVASDFMHPAPPTRALHALQAGGHEVFLLHTLAPEDLNPPLIGDLRLVESETGIGQDLTITAALHARYLANLRDWQHALRTTCEKRGMAFLTLPTDQPLLQALVSPLRQLNALSSSR